MSYDLFVFKGPIPRFYADLLRKCLGLEDLPDDKVDDSVWAMTPDESDFLIALNFAWPEAERVAKEVPKLGRKHGLAVMDPQSGLIVRP